MSFHHKSCSPSTYRSPLSAALSLLSSDKLANLGFGNISAPNCKISDLVGNCSMCTWQNSFFLFFFSYTTDHNNISPMRQKGGSCFDKLVPIPLLSPPQTNSKATTFPLISIVLMIILVTLVYLLDSFTPISFLSPVKFSDVESCVTMLLE